MSPQYLFTPYSAFLARHFSGKVQKLPVDVGATCPVRDGLIATGGCAFCNGRSYMVRTGNPQHAVVRQLEEGKRFFGRKAPKDEPLSFLAYFQNGSNTYAPPGAMAGYIAEALTVKDVAGIVLATRPDCITPEWTDSLAGLARTTFVMVELGVESVADAVLERVGRGHDVAASECAVRMLVERGIPVGVHFILGLPGDTRQTILRQAELASRWSVSAVKLHQLQILHGARMAEEYRADPGRFSLFGLDGYVRLVADYLERLDARIAVDRFVSQTPGSALVAPRWGVKADEVTARVCNELAQRGSFQGKFCLL